MLVFGDTFIVEPYHCAVFLIFRGLSFHLGSRQQFMDLTSSCYIKNTLLMIHFVMMVWIVNPDACHFELLCHYCKIACMVCWAFLWGISHDRTQKLTMCVNLL